LKLVFSADERILEDILEDIEEQIHDAQEAAVQEAAAESVRLGRANIAGAGFTSARWQQGLTSRFYPNPGKDPAALVYHKLRFAGVFERGVTIQGQPLLWLPIERNLPPDIHSPRQYGKPLVSVNVEGKPPLLFDKFDRLRGPLFFGTKSVNIRKRFDLYRIFAAVMERMQQFYDRKIKG
jgi:hypothetical protein